MANSNRHSAATRPLISYATLATWRFYPPASPHPETLYQCSPQMFPVEQVVAFVEAAHRTRDANPQGTFLPVPREANLRPAILARVVSPDGPVDTTALTCWRFWSELMTAAEAFDLLGRTKLAWKKQGFVWSVWANPDGTLDGAFNASDHKGLPDPMFQVERGPFAALADALTVTDRLYQFTAEF